jgi:hypothetical protein
LHPITPSAPVLASENRAGHQDHRFSALAPEADKRKAEEKAAGQGCLISGGIGIKEGNPMHKFQVGQFVDLIPRVIRRAAKGSYEIIHLMPENEDDPQYRVRSTAERHERVVPESELELSTKPEPVFP